MLITKGRWNYKVNCTAHVCLNPVACEYMNQCLDYLGSKFVTLLMERLHGKLLYQHSFINTEQKVRGTAIILDFITRYETFSYYD